MDINYMLAHLDAERYDKLLPISERIIPLELPETTSNGFAITKKIFDPEFRFSMTGHGGFIRYDAKTTLTMLHQGKSLWMSDSPSELRDQAALAFGAEGKVLVAGLGMGLLTAILLDQENVESVYIIELNQEIIDLISPHIETKAKEVGKTLVIECSDFEKWVDKQDNLQHFDSFILDIWGDISGEELEHMLNLWTILRCKCDNDYINGDIWGLNLAVEAMLQEMRGYHYPSEIATELENKGFSALADFVEGYDDEDEDDEWSNYEDDALYAAFEHVYGLRV